MMIKWKTCSYNNTIERVECARETDKSVWVLEYPFSFDNRESTKKQTERLRIKNGDIDKYHDTWEIAHKHLLKRAFKELDGAQSRLATTQSNLENVKSMCRPE